MVISIQVGPYVLMYICFLLRGNIQHDEKHECVMGLDIEY
jgi:hypothetical protein